jgi:hypothetical protein
MITESTIFIGVLGGFVGTVLITAGRFWKHEEPDLPGVKFLSAYFNFNNSNESRAWGSLSHYVFGTFNGIVPIIFVLLPRTIEVPIQKPVGIVIFGIAWPVVGMTLIAVGMSRVGDIEIGDYQGVLGTGAIHGVIDHGIWGAGWLLTIILFSDII